MKIFLSITALALAFMFGKSYGEKSFEQSQTYLDFVKEKESLSYEKNEYENLKTKLQNIADGGETKKTEELLAEILNVFLVDLGLRIQNKEAILAKAEAGTSAAPAALKDIAQSRLEAAATESKAMQKEPKARAKEKINFNKIKSSEWMISNALGDQEVMRALKKVEIKDINSFLSHSEYVDPQDCGSLLGVYKGAIKDINKKNFGSLELELKQALIDEKKEFFGKVAWYKNEKAMVEPFNKNCGKKIKNLTGRVFGLTNDKYVQVYKLNSKNGLAGNFYESLPNGTTKIIGSFILNRVDQF